MMRADTFNLKHQYFNSRYFLIFEDMSAVKAANILVENHVVTSRFLDRDVKVDFYFPPKKVNPSNVSLLLINDGQDLVTMNFEEILADLYDTHCINHLFCVGIHCSKDRKNEYGTANFLDYKGRGAKAALYNRFILEELMPFIRKSLAVHSFREKCMAGFSLGGLCALDMVWNHPSEFSKVGVFSGSLWWRDKDQDDIDFDEKINHIMHRQVSQSNNFYPWLKFFFEVGTLDEVADRNKNGVIDSIDDTVSFIDILVKKGYDRNADIKFLELQEGRHDVATWAKAFPEFLKWGWGGEGSK